MRRDASVLLTLAVGVLGLGLAAGSLFGSRVSTTDLGLDASNELAVAMGGADLLIVADPPKSSSYTDHELVRSYVWTVTVREVLFEASELSGQWQSPDKPLLPVQVEPGDDLEVMDNTRPGVESRFALTDEDSDRIVLALTYIDPDRSHGRSSPWSIAVVAAVAEDGSLAFLHRVVGDQQSIDFKAVHRVVDGPPGVALLTDWAVERDEMRRGGRAGPISHALAQVFAGPDATSEWLAIDSYERPLDPDLTPPAVLRELEEVRVIVSLAPAVEAADGFLVVRSESGVMHAARLGAGNHPASFLAKPGERWDIYLTSDLSNRAANRLAGHIAWSSVESRNSGDRMMIAIDGAHGMSIDHFTVSSSRLTSAEVSTMLSSWAQAEAESRMGP
ncbi:MAG: hypothetical protein HKN91_02775 [Acidimicrobiia bacterium]|nr:hypothetical protein [Acidimicrobiia bacterium]